MGRFLLSWHRDDSNKGGKVSHFFNNFTPLLSLQHDNLSVRILMNCHLKNCTTEENRVRSLCSAYRYTEVSSGSIYEYRNIITKFHVHTFYRQY